MIPNHAPDYCLRCGSTFASAYAVERHVNRTCWKTCDECCAARDPHCDCHRRGHVSSSCTRCDQQGNECTKRSGPVRGSDHDTQDTAPVVDKKWKADTPPPFFPASGDNFGSKLQQPKRDKSVSPSGSNQQLSLHPPVDEKRQPVANILRVPAYRDPNLPVIVTPTSPPLSDGNDPIIILNIMNRDTSIMLRRSQKLGPLLNAHCEQHGKKFLVEWNFIYWYRAPTMENPHKTRGHSLRWDMTPNVFDSNYQFPLRGMSNGDTLEVVEGNPRLVYGPHVIHSHGPDFVGEDPDQHLIEYHGDDQGALQTIAALESANETLRMSNEDLQLKNMQLPRLQIAYDNLRRVNERWRADFADILRENAQPRLVSYSDSD